MTVSDGLLELDAWRWWQARRLRYNIALAIAGWAAYGANALLFAAFERTIWQTWQGGVAITLFLGTGFLLVMGVANVCFLLGPWTEKVARPADVEGFRRGAWRLGFYGSIALPFIFPLGNLAMLIGQTA